MVLSKKETLKKAEELTKKLLAEEMAEIQDGVAFYKIDQGTCFGVRLINTNLIAVQRVFMSNAAIFPTHIHNESEWIIVYQGKLVIDGETLGKGKSIMFPPLTEHSIKAEENTWFIGITVPASKGYPNGKRRN